MRIPVLPALLVFGLLAPVARAAAPVASVSVATDQDYRGWHDAIVLRNRLVEVVIVPSIGRVMQFRFAGETDGPFWVNEKLAGQPMPAEPWKTHPGSFGGDKTWPAPQGAWNWPPPAAFDAMPLTARVNADHSVTLESPLAANFGLRAVRRVALDANAPVLRIETTFEKVSGTPLEVSVWVITQLVDPVGIFVPLPTASKFPNGLSPRSTTPPEFLTRDGNLLKMTRDPRRSHKINSDSATLVWAGEHQLLRIDLPRLAGESYPEEGSSIQVYTNPDPIPYVELETFGPLKTLSPGETLSATNTYRLVRRTAAGLDADVRALLAP